MKLINPGALIAAEPEETWQHDARCAQTDPEIWFPEFGTTADRAKRICAECPVRAVCLDAAMAVEGERHFKSRFGVWGGLDPLERYELSKDHPGRWPDRPRPIEHGTSAGANQHRTRGGVPCGPCGTADRVLAARGRAVRAARQAAEVVAR